MALAKHTHTPAGFNRRAVLSLAPAALIAGAAPAVAQAETPVSSLFREWSLLWAECCHLFDAPTSTDAEAEIDDLNNRMIEIEKTMLEAPKTGLMDIALAVAAATSFGLVSYEDHHFRAIQAEARALIGNGA